MLVMNRFAATRRELKIGFVPSEDSYVPNHFTAILTRTEKVPFQVKIVCHLLYSLVALRRELKISFIPSGIYFMTNLEWLELVPRAKCCNEVSPLPTIHLKSGFGVKSGLLSRSLFLNLFVLLNKC